MKPILATASSLAILASASVFAEEAKEEANSAGIVITSSATRDHFLGSQQTFTGLEYVDPMLATPQAPARTTVFLVNFAPGSRSAWHTHPAGQILIVASGKGWVQEWGKERHDMVSGDAVWIAPGVKHWHGATDKTGMSHYAIQETLGGQNVVWMEKVSDEQYQE